MPASTTYRLGDHLIHRVGYGAMQLAGPRVSGPPADPEGAKDVLRRAVEIGVNHIDTSEYYGPTVVNELIRDALHPYADDLRLVTKVGVLRGDDGSWAPWDSPENLRAGVEANLKTLGIERLAMVNLRHMGTDVPIAEQLGVLDEMRNEGKLELVGVSNMTVEQVSGALEVTDIASVQNAYSIVQRGGEDVLDFCRGRDLAFVPFSPLGSAFTGGHQRITGDPKIGEVAAKHGASPSQVALAWLLTLDHRVLLIPGTKTLSHLEDNFGAAELQLDDGDMELLATVEQGTESVPGS